SLGSASPLAANRPAIRQTVRPMLVWLPILAGVVVGLVAQGNWRRAMLFWNSSSFGVEDPQFGKDLSFYAFNLPMLNLILGMLSFILIIAFFVNGVRHYLLGSITTGNPRVGEKARVAGAARRQLAIAGGIWLTARAVGQWGGPSG